MRIAHTLYSAAAQVPAQDPAHTAGWLRYYILVALVIVGLMTFICLRGYAKGSNDEEQ